jgi:hypothetical protein
MSVHPAGKFPLKESKIVASGGENPGFNESEGFFG